MSSPRTDHANPNTTGGPLLIQKVTRAVAVTFLLVGVLGFVPGVTTDYDQMTFAGHESGAQLLGVFGVSVLHNLVHLLFGVVGLALSRTGAAARSYLIGGGLVYAVLTVYGLLVDRHSSANVVPLDEADNWLHLALAVAMTGLGLSLDHRDRGPRGLEAGSPRVG